TNDVLETITDIRRINNEPAIIQHDPIYRSLACVKINNRQPKNGDANECNSGESQRSRRMKDQTSTSNWLINFRSLVALLNFLYGIWSRAKCVAYMAMSAPNTLPAITSLTK